MLLKTFILSGIEVNFATNQVCQVMRLCDLNLKNPDDPRLFSSVTEYSALRI